jgi:hypothetical protein
MEELEKDRESEDREDVEGLPSDEDEDVEGHKRQVHRSEDDEDDEQDVEGHAHRRI